MTQLDELRYRYEARNGKIIWLAFDPAFLCIYCNEPVAALSYGGPAVCPGCDCGVNKDGTKWTSDQMYRYFRNAKERLNDMPLDPVWSEYESAHQNRVHGEEPHK